MKDSKELIEDLKHKDSSVRRHAVEMFGIIGDKEAQEAIAALGKIGGERLVEPLTRPL
jgi:HEAT repeat protein